MVNRRDLPIFGLGVNGSTSSEPMNCYQRVWVAGSMGAGKTTTSGLLAIKAATRNRCLDDFVERLGQLAVKTIFAASGEKQFRKWESELVSGFQMPIIVNGGGGTALASQNRHRIFRTAAFSLEVVSPGVKMRLRGNCNRPLQLSGLYWEQRLIPNKTVARFHLRTAKVGLLRILDLAARLFLTYA